MPASLTQWIQATRPKTLVLSLAPIAIGNIMALRDGHFNPLLFCFTLAATVGVQIVCNLANDYFDAQNGTDLPGRAGPHKLIPAGIISLRAMRWAIAIASFLTVLAGSFLVTHGGLPLAGFLAISLLLAFLYSTGPFPISRLGIGEPLVLLFFGVLPVGVSYYLQTGVWSSISFLAGISPGCLACGPLILDNYRDRAADLAAGKMTPAVRFGEQWSRRELFAIYTLATLSPLLLAPHNPWVLCSLAYLFLAVPILLILERASSREQIQQIFFLTPRVALLYASLFLITWNL